VSPPAERVWRLSLAALLHDVGKLAQRVEADPETYRSLSNLGEFTSTGPDGRLRYHHAAYTWQLLAEHAGWLAREGDAAGNVARWAARHHTPSDFGDWIVTESDRISAAMDRGHPDEAEGGWETVQTRRLTPLLGRLHGGDPSAWQAPFGALDFSRAVFPARRAPLSRSDAVREYRELFDGFRRALGEIPGGDLRRFYRSALAAYEKFAWCVPAATNTIPCDVSLFEHSRVASAVAAVLAQEVARDGDPSIDQVRDRRAERYALAVGDLSGIQRFLYTIVTTLAARSLRGRSLALQLLADAIGERILRELDLPPSCILYNGGGKIWLLLPVSGLARVRDLAEKIDEALDEEYGGRLAFGLGAVPASGETLIQDAGRLWEHATGDLLHQRRRRFARRAREDFERVFGPKGKPSEERPCAVCGKLAAALEPLCPGEEDRDACRECRDFTRLGSAATYGRCLIRTTGQGWQSRLENIRARAGLREEDAVRGWYFALPAILETGYLLSESDSVASYAERDDIVLWLNEMPASFTAPAACGSFLGGLNRARRETGETADFAALAAASDGVHRLGILRMDVDSLGAAFTDGFEKRERTISRLTNLSKALAYFFGAHLSKLVEEEPWAGKVQIIYSGGDDVFVVGAWSHIPLLALEIRRRFGEYVCQNPRWGLSGGIAVVGPHHPVSSAAKLADKAEQQAKDHRRPDGRAKDAITFLDAVSSWDELEATRRVQEVLAATQQARDGDGQRAPRAELHRWSKIAAEFRRARQAKSSTSTRPVGEVASAVERGRWAWTAAYAAAQAATGEARERVRALRDRLAETEWVTDGGERLALDRPVVELLEPAVVWADLRTRKEGR
jgi:CRISPR-associated protein Csm1